MNFGNRLQTVKDGVREAVSHLSPKDRVGVVAFDDESTVAVDGVSGADCEKVGEGLASLVGHGKTNIIDGLSESRALLQRMEQNEAGTETAAKTIALLTDGAPSTYSWDTFPELGEYGEDTADEDVDDVELHGSAATILNDEGTTVYAAGVGDYSLDVLEAIAAGSGGEWAHLHSGEEIGTFFERLVNDLSEVVALNPVLELTPRNGVTLENIVQQVPQVAKPKIEHHGDRHVVFMPNVRKGKPPRLSFGVNVPAIDPGIKTLIDVSLTVQDESVTDSIEAKVVPTSVRDSDAGSEMVRENHETATGIEQDKRTMNKKQVAKEVNTFVREN